jgi:hypothetical protein
VRVRWFPRRIPSLSRRESVRLVAPLLGAAVLVAFAAASLPWKAGVLTRPRTPFDHSAASSVAPGFAFLRDAQAVIPRGAAVVARTEPRDPIQETYFHRFALAMLPGREILPAAYYGTATSPEVSTRASYVVVVGKKPAEPPGRLLLETPDGTVWKREP